MKRAIILLLVALTVATPVLATKVACADPEEAQSIAEKLKETYDQLRFDELFADFRQSDFEVIDASDKYNKFLERNSDLAAMILGVNNICHGERIHLESLRDRSKMIASTIGRQLKMLDYKKIILAKASNSCRVTER